MGSRVYGYKALVLRVVDGDTLDLLIDLGFSLFLKRRVRLYGVDCPETRTRDLAEKSRGLRAKRFVEEWAEANPVCAVQTTKEGRGKFGRILATLWAPGRRGRSLNDTLVRRKLAEPYSGGKR